MKAVWENPYRVLGVYSNSSERDKQKNRSMINAYLGAGKSIQFSVDFPFLHMLDRTNEMIDNAIDCLQTNHDKLINSLFWFSSMNHIDVSAFDYLHDGNTEKACEIWGKITFKQDISGNYLSAYNNLSTLKLYLALNKYPIDISSIVLSINLVEKMILSDYLVDFVAAITDNTYEPDARITLNEYFVIIAETLYSFDQDNQEIELIDDLLEHKTLPPTFKTIIAQKDIDYILGLIETSKQERNAGVWQLISQAEVLSSDSLPRIARIENILGVDNAQYVSISDKVGLEILQCGIDYLYECEDDTSIDPVDDCRRILDIAKNVVKGKLAKQRVEHNAEEIKEWVTDRQRNLKIEPVQEYYDEIQERLEIFESGESGFDSINKMIKNSLPFLLCIRDILGAKDDLYLELSSLVANQAFDSTIDILNPLIKAVNQQYERYSKSTNSRAASMLHYLENQELISNLNSAKWRSKGVIESLLNLDLDKKTQTRLKINLEKIK